MEDRLVFGLNDFSQENVRKIREHPAFQRLERKIEEALEKYEEEEEELEHFGSPSITVDNASDLITLTIDKEDLGLGSTNSVSDSEREDGRHPPSEKEECSKEKALLHLCLLKNSK